MEEREKEVEMILMRAKQIWQNRGTPPTHQGGKRVPQKDATQRESQHIHTQNKRWWHKEVTEEGGGRGRRERRECGCEVADTKNTNHTHTQTVYDRNRMQ